MVSASTSTLASKMSWKQCTMHFSMIKREATRKLHWSRMSHLSFILGKSLHVLARSGRIETSKHDISELLWLFISANTEMFNLCRIYYLPTILDGRPTTKIVALCSFASHKMWQNYSSSVWPAHSIPRLGSEVTTGTI